MNWESDKDNEKNHLGGELCAWSNAILIPPLCAWSDYIKIHMIAEIEYCSEGQSALDREDLIQSHAILARINLFNGEVVQQDYYLRLKALS